MATQIEMIEGIGPAYGEKLKGAGINSVEALLEKGANPAGRSALAQETGIPAALILTWVNHADLFRIKGVGGQHAELLHAAGVDTVVELSKRNPENLAAALIQTNADKKLVRDVPSLAEVTLWIEQAKVLARVVTH